MPERGQRRANRRELVAPVDRAVAVAVAVDGEEHRRLELRQPIDDAAGAELGRAARPHGAEARGRREGDERLGDVRQVGDDPVARADPEPLQSGARACDLLAQIGERELTPVARLRVGDDRDPVRVLVVADEVLGVVEPGAREPRRARHLLVGEDCVVPSVRLDLEEVPDRGPEGG